MTFLFFIYPGKGLSTRFIIWIPSVLIWVKQILILSVFFSEFFELGTFKKRVWALGWIIWILEYLSKLLAWVYWYAHEERWWWWWEKDWTKDGDNNFFTFSLEYDYFLFALSCQPFFVHLVCFLLCLPLFLFISHL